MHLHMWSQSGQDCCALQKENINKAVTNEKKESKTADDPE